MDSARFEQIKISGRLPSPKGVALAVTRLTLQEDIAMPALAQLIRTDPAFVGRLIKAANGVARYRHRPIASIEDALTVLGLPAVRNLALGFSLIGQYGKGPCAGFDYPAFWSDCLLQAVVMQAVAQRIRFAAPDEAYCLGLLSRVGELALATLHPEDYGRLIEEAGHAPLRLLSLEQKAFALTNAELGYMMLDDWGVPRLFSEAVKSVLSGFATAPAEISRVASLERALRLARQFPQVHARAGGAHLAEQAILLELAAELDFDENDLALLEKDVLPQWQEWGQILSIPVSVQAGTMQPAPADEAAQASVGASSLQHDGGDERSCVLLVEPSCEAASALASALREAGYRVLEAGRGSEAVEAVLEFQPGVMLLASELPDMSARDLLASLRRTRAGRGLYVALMSDENSEKTLLEGLEAGADEVLVRPVSARLMLARLGAAQRLVALHDEIRSDRDEIHSLATELALNNRRLKEVALTDPLTGLSNRRFFNERLAHEWARAAQEGHALSCILVDVDYFKAVNDAYGHDGGDEVLRAVATAIRGSVRIQDFPARLGGDEFVILCPNTPLGAARQCAERILRAVHRAALSPALGATRVSISLGVAARMAGVDTPDGLIKQADLGLYIAKRAGRDCVGCAQHEVAR